MPSDVMKLTLDIISVAEAWKTVKNLVFKRRCIHIPSVW